MWKNRNGIIFVRPTILHFAAAHQEKSMFLIKYAIFVS